MAFIHHAVGKTPVAPASSDPDIPNTFTINNLSRRYIHTRSLTVRFVEL